MTDDRFNLRRASVDNVPSLSVRMKLNCVSQADEELRLNRTEGLRI